jgi:D-sedoheptulose 7-phosphate isomerase
MMVRKSTEAATVLGTYISTIATVIDELPVRDVERIVDVLFNAYARNKAILIVGNGGSAATAAHWACDLAKTSVQDRPGAQMRALALTCNTSVITALANDLGYDMVFAEQVRSVGQPGDVLVVISASGNSPNVVEAAKVARAMGITVVGVLGFGGGAVRTWADVALVVASSDYGPVEDAHMVVGHAVTTALRDLIGRSVPESRNRAAIPIEGLAVSVGR